MQPGQPAGPEESRQGRRQRFDLGCPCVSNLESLCRVGGLVIGVGLEADYSTRARKSYSPWACGRTGTSGPPGNKLIAPLSALAGIMFSLEHENASCDPDNTVVAVAAA